MTPKQRLALAYVKDHPGASPAFVGHAMTPHGHREFGRPLHPQGAGRLGGAMLWRLRTLGWVREERDRRGFSAGWHITSEGRKALEDGQ